RTIYIDVKENIDQTFSLIFNVRNEDHESLETFEKVISQTEVNRPSQPISDERIAELLQIPDQMKKRVFGIDHVLDQLGEALLASEEGRQVNSETKKTNMPATTFMALGKTSTGKSETPKVLAD